VEIAEPVRGGPRCGAVGLRRAEDVVETRVAGATAAAGGFDDMTVNPERTYPMHIPAAGTADAGTGAAAVDSDVDVSIVLVVYRTPQLLRQCLASIEAATPRLGYEVIVLDNAPLDPASERVAEDWGRRVFGAAASRRIQYRANRENLGFARAVNQGIRLARGRYYLVLNPDVEVRPGSIEALAGYLDATPEAGLVAPRLHDPDGSLQYSCRTFYTMPIFLLRRTFLGRLFPNARVIRDHLMRDFDHETTRDVDWCIGGSLMARREAVTDVGPMDERFFLYFEDVDWCYRMHQRGWRVVYHPSARMVHHYQRSSAGWKPSRGLWAHLASTVRFFEKWSFVLYWLKLRGRVFRRAAFILNDLLAVTAAFVVAYGIRSLAGGILVKPLFEFEQYTRFLGFTLLVAVGSFFTFGHYRERPSPHFLDTLLPVARSLFWTSVLIMASTFLISTRFYSRILVVLFFPLAVVLVTTGRVWLIRLVESFRKRDLNLRRVGILGPPAAVEAIMQRIGRSSGLGIEPIPITPRPESRTPRRDGSAGRAEASARDLRTPEGLSPELLVRRLRAERVHEVVLFEDYPGDVPAVLATLRSAGLPIRLVPVLREVFPTQGSLTRFMGLPVVAFGDAPSGATRAPSRRLFDLFAALAIGVVGALPFLALALGRLWRRSPLLERCQLRGAGGRKVVLRRLASVSATGGVGRALFAFYPSVPALAAGELSLVGIYPFPDRDWEQLDSTYRAAPPDAPLGIVGPWTRGPLPAAALCEWNRAYAENWSPPNDLRILWRALRGIPDPMLTGS